MQVTTPSSLLYTEAGPLAVITKDQSVTDVLRRSDLHENVTPRTFGQVDNYANRDYGDKAVNAVNHDSQGRDTVELTGVTVAIKAGKHQIPVKFTSRNASAKYLVKN